MLHSLLICVTLFSTMNHSIVSVVLFRSGLSAFIERTKIILLDVKQNIVIVCHNFRLSIANM